MIGNNSIEGNKLVDRIAEQKLSFSIVERMLQDNRKNQKGEENRDIIEMINELHALKMAFDKIEVKTSSVKGGRRRFHQRQHVKIADKNKGYT